ncbi:hypothetical protein K458DRAFT_146174 [Lentithecium fluviatile CBS 122367]|uniref:Uncharacterized protein n=1 Tax=Lentithecium fluviatile CBS 122367 TaxID=1168545 RepID=A0A6G1JCM7_9PLEO|nr:hypothetical protein K458DRAFT_146174 [Lentithecium fluviatile CBS 122367]
MAASRTLISGAFCGWHRAESCSATTDAPPAFHGVWEKSFLVAVWRCILCSNIVWKNAKTWLLDRQTSSSHTAFLTPCAVSHTAASCHSPLHRLCLSLLNNRALFVILTLRKPICASSDLRAPIGDLLFS